MSFTITSDSAFGRQHLTLKSDRVELYDTNGGERAVRFADIYCLLISEENSLSIQTDNQVFSIATDPANKDHQAVIAALVHQVREAEIQAAAD